MSADKIRVLFVCDRPDFRCYKLAKALKDTGLAEPCLLANAWDVSLHAGAFYDVKAFGMEFSAAFFLHNTLKRITHGRLAFLSDPILKAWLRKKLHGFGQFDIIHAVAPPVALSKLAIESATSKVIFDQYDLLLQTSGNNHRWPSEIRDEIFCLRKADALVHKGPIEELDFYRELGHSIRAPDISFPDGCDETLFQPIPGKKLRDSDGQWHVVYAGGIHGPGKDYYLLPFFEKLTKQGIHVHVYPAPWSRDHEELGVYYAEKSGFIHMHDTVPYRELVKEMSGYDFGLYYFEFDDAANPDLTRKAKTAAGNKIPSYYEAGIPVLIAKKIEYSAGFIAHDRSGILIGPEDVPHLSVILKGCDYNALVTSVSAARKQWSGTDRVKKLAAFYRAILQR